MAGSVVVEDSNIIVDLRDAAGPTAVLSLELQKTKRIPEDGKAHGLPPYGGALPLSLARNATQRFIPREWLKRDVVLAPVANTQAMWVNFTNPTRFSPFSEAAASYPFAIIMATGGVNVFDAKPWTDQLRADPVTRQQNYVTSGSLFRSGHQRWVDGYKVRDGVVRQFVATSRGSGTSIEEYLTGQVRWGGIQIAVYPLKAEVWERVKGSYMASGTRSRGLGGTRSARSLEMDMSAGGEIQQQIEFPAFAPSDYDQAKGVRFWITMVEHDAWPYLMGTQAPRPLLNSSNDTPTPFAGAPGVNSVKQKQW